MANSRNWSSASAPCRLDWRASRALAGALAALGVLAAVAVIASEMPLWASLPGAAAALVHGLRLARRELRRPSRCLSIAANGGAAAIDGERMNELELQWRGPLPFLRWRDPGGRVRRLVGVPDMLDAGARRELRLALDARSPARAARSVAR